jgi:hypothetical protein
VPPSPRRDSLLAVAVIALILGRAFSLPDASDQVKGWTDIGIAVALVALALWLWLRPARAEGVLRPVSAWLAVHSRTINVIILLVFAAVLLVRGAGAL